MRGLAAIAAMIVALSTAWLVLSPASNPAEGPSPLRVVLSIVLLFGIAFLGAAVAILLDRQARP